MEAQTRPVSQNHQSMSQVNSLPTNDTHEINVGRYKTWTLDSGLDYGLDYGLGYGLDFGLGWTLNSVLELLFKEDFECWIAQ